MKLISALCLFLVLATRVLGQDIDAVLQKYRDAFARQDEQEAKALAPVRAEYMREITKVRDSARNSGNLDGVVAAEALLKAEQEGGAGPKTLSATLQQAKANFEKARDIALRNYAPNRQRLETEFEKALSELEQRFTKAGNVDAAKSVRDRRATIDFTGADILSTLSGEAERKGGLVVVKDKHAITSQHFYAAPVEITYVIMTTSQVRIGYAATEIILNWEGDATQLRIDGDPASGQYVKGAGTIEKNKWLTVKQIVRSNEMELFVNGERRARWTADFSGVNMPISIRPAVGTLSVKQIQVKNLPKR